MKKPIAKLRRTMMERGYGKNPYQWVPAYAVTSPSKGELQPYFRVHSTQYETSALEFCKKQGWRAEYENKSSS